MTLMRSEIGEQPAVLENCLIKNRTVMNALVEELKKREIHSVILVARGTSDNAALYGKYLLEIKLGLPVSMAAPSVLTLYGKSLQTKNSLVVGLSQSGKAQDVLEVILAAKAAGAVTAAITNQEDSPLAKACQFPLFCGAGLEKSVAATKTFTSQMLLMAELTALWSGDAQLNRELALVPAVVQKTLDTENAIAALSARYRFVEECFVLARGINYATALEAGLKIQETTYTRARAYAASDFHHGPFAMVEKDTPVVVIAPRGPSYEGMLEMIKKLKGAGADILALTNGEEAAALSDCTLHLPECGEFITPFAGITAGQLFALNLALCKGLNPDSPRGLSKVTVTR